MACVNFSILIVLALASITLARELGDAISPKALEALMDNDDVQFLFDFRTNVSRDLEGYIETSILVPEDLTLEQAKAGTGKEIFKKSNGRDVVVYVADDPVRAKEAETILAYLGYSNVQCYLGGMKEWAQAGGLTKYPKFVTFTTLNQLLDSNLVTLIDVRNRTELNTVGQIPGSVVLPLHEVGSAMELSSEEFSEKYKFAKPDPADRKMVLTCRSGRRVLVADEIMQKYGYDQLRIYSGSFNEWLAKKGKTIQGNFQIDYDV